MQRRGFVLVSVLWVTAILTVLAIGFGRRAMLDARASAVSVDYAKVRAEARGQVQEGAADIVNTMALFQLLSSARFNLPIPQFQFKPAPEPEFIGEGAERRIEDMAYFTIEDEERKVAINAAPEEMLESVPGLTFAMVNEIIRRRGGETADDEPTPFQSLEEVRELANLSDDEWFGDGLDPGMRDMITLWGDGKLNINSASEDVLRLIPEIDDAIVAGIIEFRRGADGELGTEDDQQFANIEDVRRRLEVSAEGIQPLREHGKVQSSYYRVTGVSTSRGGKVRASTTAVIAVNGGQSEVLRWAEDNPRG